MPTDDGERRVFTRVRIKDPDEWGDDADTSLLRSMAVLFLDNPRLFVDLFELTTELEGYKHKKQDVTLHKRILDG